MLATAQPVLRRFWYPTVRIEQLADGPTAFTLLGEDLVVWLDDSQRPAAAVDRCIHRSARLSRGTVHEGAVQCPYHGWRYAPSGECVRIPQTPEQPIPGPARIRSFRCQVRYGFVWVCLDDDPLDDIPAITEADDPAFRLIPVPAQDWACNGLVVMENLFDNAHHHFVHNGYIGDKDSPLVPPLDTLEETPQGIFQRNVMRNFGSDIQAKAWGVQPGEVIQLVREFTWYMPFTAKLHLIFPGGMQQITILSMTPVHDGTSQLSAVVLRSDTEEQTPADQVLAQSAVLLEQDQEILESTDHDTPLDLHQQWHMASDKAGIMMRRRLAALLEAHGEREATRHHALPAPAVPPAGGPAT